MCVYIYLPHLLYPLICWWTIRLLPHLVIVNNASMNIWEVKLLSHVQLFVIPWTAAYQVLPSMEFSRQEYWSGLPFPSPGELPDPGIESRSPTWQTDTLPTVPTGNIWVHIPFWISLCFLWYIYPGVELLDCMVVLFLVSLRNLYTAFHSGGTDLHPTTYSVQGFPLLHIATNICCLWSFSW